MPLVPAFCFIHYRRWCYLCWTIFICRWNKWRRRIHRRGWGRAWGTIFCLKPSQLNQSTFRLMKVAHIYRLEMEVMVVELFCKVSHGVNRLSLLPATSCCNMAMTWNSMLSRRLLVDMFMWEYWINLQMSKISALVYQNLMVVDLRSIFCNFSS
jgi:hypothetical protein